MAHHNPQHHIYDLLRTEWLAIGRSPEAKRAMTALATRDATLAALGADDLCDLVGRVHRDGPHSLPADQAAGVVAAVLRSADVHPLGRRTVLQMLWPGLIGVARSLGGLRRVWPSAADLHGDAVSTLWEVIAAWAGEDRPWAVRDILSAVRCRLRRQALATEAERSRRDDLDLTNIAAGTERTDLEALALALTEPEGLGIERRSAAVVCLTRVHGYSLEEVARLTGTTRGQLQHGRARAERCLLAG